MLLVIFNSSISFSCRGWDLVADHLGFRTFCSFESASSLLYAVCMFVDGVVSLMSLLSGYFRMDSHGVWSRVFPRTDIISTRRHIVLVINILNFHVSVLHVHFSQTLSASFFNRCYVQKASNKYTKFFTKCCHDILPPKPAPSSLKPRQQVVLLPIFLGVGFNTMAPKICKAQFARENITMGGSTSTVMAKVDPRETSLQGGPPTSHKCDNSYK